MKGLPKQSHQWAHGNKRQKKKVAKAATVCGCWIRLPEDRRYKLLQQEATRDRAAWS